MMKVLNFRANFGNYELIYKFLEPFVHFRLKARDKQSTSKPQL